MTLPRSLIVLLATTALALGVGACGGSDDDETSTATSTPAAQSAADGSGAQAGAGETGGEGEAGAEGSPSSGGDGGDGDENGGSGGGGKVDLSVDPGKIKGAVVTRTGAVQTLEPDPEAQETAQENTYPSIEAFGEEAEGAEATNITFALVQYLDARARGDWTTACARLYSLLREKLEGEGQGCPQLLGTLMAQTSQGNLAEQAKIDVSSVRRGEGNRAFVIYKTPATLSADMPMYVEDGVWKVGAIEAYALRPEQVG